MIHKRRPYNVDEDVGQPNPLFDCDAIDKPEYKTILIPTPIVVVERLPEIFGNNINNATADEDTVHNAENEEKRSTPIAEKSNKDAKSGSKRKKTSKLKAVKKFQVIRRNRTPKAIPSIEKIV